MWDIEDDDLCDVDLEVESGGAGIRPGYVGIPLLPRYDLDLLWCHRDAWSIIDSYRDCCWRSGNSHWRSTLRKGPSVNTSMRYLALT